MLAAMVDVFGVLAYSAQQRRRELGIRIAFGATPASVIVLVIAGAAFLYVSAVHDHRNQVDCSPRRKI